MIGTSAPRGSTLSSEGFVPIDPDTVVEGLERQFPREWLEQVSIRRKESIRVEKKRSFMDRLAEVKW